MLADYPTRYNVNVLSRPHPSSSFPEVSTERRDYVPIGWLEPPDDSEQPRFGYS